MPSLVHEALVMLFRNRPSLAAELMRDALGEAIPAHDAAEVQEATLSQIVPTEYHADLVVLLRADKPVFGIVVEVQLQRDEDKQFSWPLYAAALRAKLRCPACVLVVCADLAVARWARRAIATGQPRCPFVPLVLGPETIPRITDSDAAKQAPELAVLSVQAHGREDIAVDIARAVLGAFDALDREKVVLYSDLVWEAVSEAARRKLGEIMLPQGYVPRSPLAKRIVESHAEGTVQGLVQALLRILARRGLKLDAQQEQTIRACTEPGLLEQWIDRALTAKSVKQVLRTK